MSTAVLKRIDDPRSNLEKARRPELVRFARANGMADISEAMPANLIRRRLVAAGLTRIQVSAPPLGLAPGASQTIAPDAPVNVVDADDDLERQFAREQAAAKPIKGMAINELRAECKRLGIRLSRRDNMATMKEKIEAHG